MSSPQPMPAEELATLVEGLSLHSELWRDSVVHEPGERQFVLIARTSRIEAWAVAWMDGHDTGFHDHDVSAAAIAVFEGEVVDERMSVTGEGLATTHSAGATFTVDAGDIHRVRHTGDGPAITLHAYSPPLERMGSYAVSDDGRLQRTPLAGDTALTS